MDYVVSFDDGSEKASISFNVCDYAKRTHPDGKRDYANLLLGDAANGSYKHLSSSNIEDVKV